MLRVIFFGMDSKLSLAPLAHLIQAGVEVGAVIVPVTWPVTEALPRRLEPPPPTENDLPIINPYLDYNIIHLAWEHNIPVWGIGTLENNKTLRLLANLQPDLIAVACFPYIFPPQLLQLPRYGCLNLHPSLLPAYRGPTPLFWMAYHGETQAGVTLHVLSEAVDSGDIIFQKRLPWPVGLSGRELKQLCANEGGKLLAAAIERLARSGTLPRSPQPETGASYFPHPTEEDFLISTFWEARRAFNFMRAANAWPLLVDLGSERFFVRRAVNYKPGQEIEQPYIRYNDNIWVQFWDGVLKIAI